MAIKESIKGPLNYFAEGYCPNSDFVFSRGNKNIAWTVRNSANRLSRVYVYIYKVA
jgi:hypothetical protein